MWGNGFRENCFKGTPSRIELSLRPPWLSRARLAGPHGPLLMPDILLQGNHIHVNRFHPQLSGHRPVTCRCDDSDSCPFMDTCGMRPSGWLPDSNSARGPSGYEFGLNS